MQTTTTTLMTAGLVLLVVGLSNPAGALHGGTHEYEGFGAFTQVTDQYDGYTYDGATTLCRPSYNYGGYPPVSGDCVVYSPGGTIAIDLDDFALGFSAWFSKGSGDLTITLSLAGVPVETIDCSDAGYGSSTECASAAGLPYNEVLIEGLGNYYTMDDATFGSPL